MNEKRQGRGPDDPPARLRLARTVQCVERMLDRHAGGERSLSVTVGERALSVNTELVALATEMRSADRALRDRVIRGLAWQVQVLGDLGQGSADSATPGDPASNACLAFDLAVGELLVEELSRTLDRDLRSVDARWFQSLAQLRAAISRLCEEIRAGRDSGLEGDARRLVSLIHAEGGVSEYLTGARRGHELESKPPGRIKCEPCLERNPSRRFVERLAALLVVALVVHVALHAPSWLAERSGKVFELSDFSRVPGVVEMEDCPPSVLLTVRDAAWSRLDGDGRRALLDQTRTIVTPRGYQGVLLSTESGDVVGQWATHSGILLYEPQ